MTDSLKSLEQWNAERFDHVFSGPPYINGIACPTCGKELYDADNLTLTGYPPKKNIRCLHCGYTGTRFV